MVNGEQILVICYGWLCLETNYSKIVMDRLRRGCAKLTFYAMGSPTSTWKTTAKVLNYSMKKSRYKTVKTTTINVEEAVFPP